MAATANPTLDEGWVLHSRPFRDTSVILEVLSRRQGRCGVVARAGRRNRLLQLFQPLAFNLAGRGELHRLGHVEVRGPAPTLHGRALYCGFYLNEVLIRVLHRDDPHPGLVDIYEDTLRGLAQSETARDIVLRRFEMALLEELGYGFPLDRDLHGAPVEPGRRYQFFPEQGLTPDEHGLEGSALLALAAGQWSDPARRAARSLMRAALAPHLGERPLKSRSLFRGGE